MNWRIPQEDIDMKHTHLYYVSNLKTGESASKESSCGDDLPKAFGWEPSECLVILERF